MSHHSTRSDPRFGRAFQLLDQISELPLEERRAASYLVFCRTNDISAADATWTWQDWMRDAQHCVNSLTTDRQTGARSHESLADAFPDIVDHHAPPPVDDGARDDDSDWGSDIDFSKMRTPDYESPSAPSTAESKRKRGDRGTPVRQTSKGQNLAPRSADAGDTPVDPPVDRDTAASGSGPRNKDNASANNAPTSAAHNPKPVKRNRTSHFIRPRQKKTLRVRKGNEKLSEARVEDDIDDLDEGPPSLLDNGDNEGGPSGGQGDETVRDARAEGTSQGAELMENGAQGAAAPPAAKQPDPPIPSGASDGSVDAFDQERQLRAKKRKTEQPEAQTPLHSLMLPTPVGTSVLVQQNTPAFHRKAAVHRTAGDEDVEMTSPSLQRRSTSAAAALVSTNKEFSQSHKVATSSAHAMQEPAVAPSSHALDDAATADDQVPQSSPQPDASTADKMDIDSASVLSGTGAPSSQAQPSYGLAQVARLPMEHWFPTPGFATPSFPAVLHINSSTLRDSTTLEIFAVMDEALVDALRQIPSRLCEEDHIRSLDTNLHHALLTDGVRSLANGGDPFADATSLENKKAMARNTVKASNLNQMQMRYEESFYHALILESAALDQALPRQAIEREFMKDMGSIGSMVVHRTTQLQIMRGWERLQKLRENGCLFLIGYRHSKLNKILRESRNGTIDYASLQAANDLCNTVYKYVFKCAEAQQTGDHRGLAKMPSDLAHLQPRWSRLTGRWAAPKDALAYSLACGAPPVSHDLIATEIVLKYGPFGLGDEARNSSDLTVVVPCDQGFGTVSVRTIRCAGVFLGIMPAITSYTPNNVDGGEDLVTPLVRCNQDPNLRVVIDEVVSEMSFVEFVANPRDANAVLVLDRYCDAAYPDLYSFRLLVVSSGLIHAFGRLKIFGGSAEACAALNAQVLTLQSKAPPSQVAAPDYSVDLMALPLADVTGSIMALYEADETQRAEDMQQRYLQATYPLSGRCDIPVSRQDYDLLQQQPFFIESTSVPCLAAFRAVYNGHRKANYEKLDGILFPAYAILCLKGTGKAPRVKGSLKIPESLRVESARIQKSKAVALRRGVKSVAYDATLGPYNGSLNLALLFLETIEPLRAMLVDRGWTINYRPTDPPTLRVPASSQFAPNTPQWRLLDALSTVMGDFSHNSQSETVVDHAKVQALAIAILQVHPPPVDVHGNVLRTLVGFPSSAPRATIGQPSHSHASASLIDLIIAISHCVRLSPNLSNLRLVSSQSPITSKVMQAWGDSSLFHILWVHSTCLSAVCSICSVRLPDEEHMLPCIDLVQDRSGVLAEMIRDYFTPGLLGRHKYCPECGEGLLIFGPVWSYHPRYLILTCTLDSAKSGSLAVTLPQDLKVGFGHRSTNATSTQGFAYAIVATAECRDNAEVVFAKRGQNWYRFSGPDVATVTSEDVCNNGEETETHTILLRRVD